MIEGFRWCVLRPPDARLAMLGVSILSVAAFLVGGAFYFRRMEKTFADLV